ncbi:hypothetical protein, partial [Klebsiella pneumoniae]
INTSIPVSKTEARQITMEASFTESQQEVYVVGNEIWQPFTTPALSKGLSTSTTFAISREYTTFLGRKPVLHV